MSVINQALKDLEQRNLADQGFNSEPLIALELPNSRLKYLVIVLGFICAVLVAIGWSWQAKLWSMPPSQIVEPPLPVSLNLPVAVAAEVKQLPVKVTQIKQALEPLLVPVEPVPEKPQLKPAVESVKRQQQQQQQQQEKEQSLQPQVDVVAKQPPKYEEKLAPITQLQLP